MRNTQEIADDLDGNDGRELRDQIGSALRLDSIQQGIDDVHESVLHLGDGSRRQGTRDDPPNSGVERRIIENQARRVMLV